MAEFLELVESIQSQAASKDRLFGDAGRSVRGRQDPKYLAKLAEAVKFVNGVFKGTVPMYRLQEALTTSDFPNLFGDVLDRQMLANYRETPYSWNMYARRRTVKDFRTVNLFALNGAEDRLDEVAEQEEYPETSVSDAKYSFAVKKYGKKIPFSWEAIINDDLDAFRDIPERLGRSARRTEEHFATTLFAGANGPDTTFFSNANKNIVNQANGASSDNPALSISALQEAFTVLSKQRDANNQPIAIDMVTLVVPPALMVVAQNILNSTELRLTANGGESNQQLIVTNWMKNKVRLVVNDYLPIVSSNANGDTSWYLFASPEAARPALVVGFLRGHEEPEIFVKAPDAQRIGGSVDPMAGDFETDSRIHKVRHVLGGTTVDPKMAIASNGSGA